MTVVVADASALVAAADKRDRNHSRCATAIREHLRAGIIVPATVTVEVDYLLRYRLGAHAARAFLDDVNAGRFQLEPIDADLFAQSVAIDKQVADINIGLVDGTVVAVADRWAAAAILSLDDHFRVIAPQFELRPD